MINFYLIAGLVATVASISSVPALAADGAFNTAQVESQATSIQTLQQAAATAAGYRAIDVEVKSTLHQVTITVVNSKLNAGLPEDRRNEASKIVQAVERVIAGKGEFRQVMMLHLDYVSRQGNKSKIIQGFDFNKSPSGSFVPHMT